MKTREQLNKDLDFEYHYANLYGMEFAWPRIQVIVQELEKLEPEPPKKDRRVVLFEYKEGR